MRCIYIGCILTKPEIFYFKKTLRNYMEDNPIRTPILATFTSTYTASEKGSNNLLKIWTAFRHLMATSTTLRRFKFPLVAWALEFSEFSVHVHAIFEDYFSAQELQKIWRKQSVSCGWIDVREFDSPVKLIEYVFKKYSRVSKFLGHSANFRPEHIYSENS